MSKIVLLLLVLLPGTLFSQVQVLRGRIVEEVSQKSIAGATIILTGKENFQANSDSAGYYTLSVPAGNYILAVMKDGYGIQQKPNVIIMTGKQVVYDFELRKLEVKMDTLEIKSGEGNDPLMVTPALAQKHAAVFYDPARAVTLHAALINSDDQANHISVHGTSPNYIQWKLEGVEVVNPNHLENAGTINDRPAMNGGGVSMISAQLLSEAAFQLAPFDPASGNALSGIFDIRLRKGNDEKSERIIQVGLLGSDVSVEGPFSKKSRASYLINLRYSTVGLLSYLGVDFGDERINYKDLSYHISLPLKQGSIRLFGVAGNSETLFDGQADSAMVEAEKELQNTNYYSNTAINGISFLKSIGSNAHFKTVAGYSVKNVRRRAEPAEGDFLNSLHEKDKYMQQKISSLTYFSFGSRNSFRLKAGSSVNYFISRVISTADNEYLADVRIYDPLLQPFVSASGTFRKFDFEGGLHGFYQQRINYFSLQPRMLIRYNFSTGYFASLKYGLATQIHAPDLYANGNTDLKPVSSHSFMLENEIKIRKLSLRSALFYQLYNDIPVNDSSGFSAFNYFNGPVPFMLTGDGNAEVYGMDASFNGSLQSYDVSVSGSVYNSRYNSGSKSYRKGRFNSDYNIVIAAGREFKISAAKYFEIYLKWTRRNGFRTPTISGNEYLFDGELPFYSRADLRISYRKDRKKATYIWSLDIQNVTARKNISYYYFDNVKGQTEPRYQLGIIPVLSFKVLF